MEDVFVRKKINSDNSFKNDLKTCKTNFCPAANYGDPSDIYVSYSKPTQHLMKHR